jgi:UDP-glucose 4-epimerase
VVDISRLIGEFGYTPRTTQEAFDDFIAAHTGGASLTADRLAAAEQSILDGIRAVRASASAAAGGDPS